MSNENYFNHYVDSLKNTMMDAVMKSVSLQASIKMSEETINELTNTVDLLDAEIGKIKEDHEKERNALVQEDSTRINELQERLNGLTAEINDLRQQRTEFESVRNNAKHVDTFRNELLKSREENEKLKLEYENTIRLLNEKIGYLQLTPAKRKKIDEQNAVKDSEINNKEHIEDGGSF